MFVATVLAYIAKRNFSQHLSYSYLTGLFHDSSIPLMLKQFPDYDKIFELALANERNILQIEQDKYNTDHCIVSSILVKTWGLSDII
ncbi:signal transduction protein, partial [Candidatus Magnetoovum chiemensis]